MSGFATDEELEALNPDLRDILEALSVRQERLKASQAEAEVLFQAYLKYLRDPTKNPSHFRVFPNDYTITSVILFLRKLEDRGFTSQVTPGSAGQFWEIRLSNFPNASELNAPSFLPAGALDSPSFIASAKRL